MAQYQESTPIQERQSRNIGIGHYLKELAPPIVAGLVALVADVLRTIVKPTSTKLALKTVSLAALAVTPFLIWRKLEKQRVGVEDIYEQYKQARPSRMDNDDIAKENALLKKMVAYEERQLETPKHVQDIVAHGPKSHGEHAAHETAEVTR